MRSDTVIELSRYLQRSPEPAASSVQRENWRLRRRLARMLSAVEAAITVCIGAGFLVCLGLVFSML